MNLDMHDLRVGDLVLRELDLGGGQMSRHLGEVASIRARIHYLDVGYDYREWWDFRAGCPQPLIARDGVRLRLTRAPTVLSLG